MKCKERGMSGRLRHKAVLQEEVRTPDTAGGYVRSWKDVVELWVEITPVAGKEYGFAQGIQAEVTHKVVMRYRSGVYAGMRLVMNERAFNIRSVMNVSERGEVLELQVTEGVAT